MLITIFSIHDVQLNEQGSYERQKDIIVKNNFLRISQRNLMRLYFHFPDVVHLIYKTVVSACLSVYLVEYYHLIYKAVIINSLAVCLIGVSVCLARKVDNSSGWPERKMRACLFVQKRR